MTVTERAAAQTPMSDHIARFIGMLDGERRILVEHPDPAIGTTVFAPDFTVALKARLSAVLPPCDGVGVGVKALEWFPSSTGRDGDSHTVPTEYTVRYADENGWKWARNGGFGFAESSELAKSAAQSDYDRRIRSALTAVPVAGEPEVIDLELEAWKVIKGAASKSPWIPPEYYQNDWVSDVCDFLASPVPAAVERGTDDRRLYDKDEFMADGEVEMTAAEDVLAWLLIEKLRMVDDRNYTPQEASDALASAIDRMSEYEDRLAALSIDGETAALLQRALDLITAIKPLFGNPADPIDKDIAAWLSSHSPNPTEAKETPKTWGEWERAQQEAERSK